MPRAAKEDNYTDFAKAINSVNATVGLKSHFPAGT
jgi:hypothetical protein